MTVRQLIARAATGDAGAAGRLADFLRFKHRMNYGDILSFVQRTHPDLGAAEWDALLYESERRDD